MNDRIHLLNRAKQPVQPSPATESLLPAGLPQNPSDYLDILRFRWYWVAAAVALGALGSQVAVRYVPKRFVSRTVVLVESDKIPRNFIPQITTEQSSDRLRTINEEILARPRVERILEELSPYPELIDVPRADIVDMVRRRTTILLRGKDAFVLEYADTDPERAQRIATRLASLFIEETSGDRQRQVQGANEFIDSQLEETKHEMERVEASLRELKQRYMGMLPNQLEANLSTLQRMEQERQSVAEQIRSAKDRRGLLERQLSLQAQMNEPEAQLLPDIPVTGTGADTAAADPNGSSLASLKAYLANLETRYTTEHPEVVAVRSRIARLEREQAEEQGKAEAAALASENPAGNVSAPEASTSLPTDFLVSDLRAQIAAIDRDIEILQTREQELQGGIGRYQARVEKIPEVEQELQSLERDYGLISGYYSELLSRKLEAETAGAVERRWKEDHFKVLDPATVPDKAAYPKASAFLLLGTLIGAGAGLAIAFFFEVIDPSVKNMRELEALLPYPVLLTLPNLNGKRKLFSPRRRSSPLPPAASETLSRFDQDMSA